MTTNQPAHEDLDAAALNRETVAAQPTDGGSAPSADEIVQEALEFFGDDEDDAQSPASDADAPARAERYIRGPALHPVSDTGCNA